MMKLNGIATTLVTMLIVLVFVPAVTFADFNSGSTGADGPLAPPTSPTTYVVPALGNDDGVYNFTTVTIPAGVTVTFQKNANNTPITIKASGDVTINGTLSVKGADGSVNASGVGGPGGFNGGLGGYIYTPGFRGQGPGGGSGGLSASNAAGGGGGGFAGAGGNGNKCTDNSSINNCQTNTNQGVGGASYGNTSLIPLIGGSGGGGGSGLSSVGGGGGGGGGAILIASSGTIWINGAITANGGNGAFPVATQTYQNGGGGGSGGSIRLVANSVTGEGSITATGGAGLYNSGQNYVWNGGSGSGGRIRIETWVLNRNADTNPSYRPVLWSPAALYPTSTPSLAVTQINGNPVPATTSGAFRTPDVTLPYNTSGPVTVTVTAQNIPAGTTVTVKALPESGNSAITAAATLDATFTAQVQLTLSSGTSYVLSASANY